MICRGGSFLCLEMLFGSFAVHRAKERLVMI